MIVLDTTVLLYAKGAEHRFRDPCRELIAAIADEQVEATTTAEVIQEFVHVRARRRSRSDAVALGRDYAEMLSPLMTVTPEDLRNGLALFERIERMGAFDAVLAATAMGAGGRYLVSADAAFAEFDDVEHIVPDKTGIGALLADTR